MTNDPENISFGLKIHKETTVNYFCCLLLLDTPVFLMIFNVSYHSTVIILILWVNALPFKNLLFSLSAVQ